MQDYGTEGWAFRTVFLLVDNAGKKWAEKDCWFWRYQPWTMREKFLFSNYWAGTSGVPARMMPLFVRYHKSVGKETSFHRPDSNPSRRRPGY